ncbi:hypothetical protein EMCG_03910 [[Emmonsia] crescens]|uniref:Uncharacterized protein n=1 Tax=[Emmonsia] crescens TaxID=73230 RepID=A0A0G2IZI8_9EURO|nr:hypothetical protein EMCG_03910 [Emmonsia crescens UAMH 3008]
MKQEDQLSLHHVQLPRRSPSSDTADESFAADTGSEPDYEYETELTNPDISPPRAGRRGKEHEHREVNRFGSPYKDPPDDTDEDLSDIGSDYGGSGKTKKLKLRARDRWQRRYCAKKALEPAADLKWSDPEKALRGASAKDVHRFWNWVFGKLERGEGSRKLKGNPVSEEMSEDVRQGMRSLADKYSLKKQPRDNIPVYIEDMVPFNQTILQT